MNAIGTVSPHAACRSVAIRRPGCVASLIGPSRSPQPVAVAVDRADELDDHLTGPEERLRLAVAEIADPSNLQAEL